MANQNIILYSVACEPAVGGYALLPSFMKSIANTCSGKYVPLSDATLLSRIIIGGCREELNLFKLTNRVIELYDEMKDSTDLNKIPSRIAKKFCDDGVTIPILHFDDFSQDSMFSHKSVFDTSKSLKKAKQILKEKGAVTPGTRTLGGTMQKANISMSNPTSDHIKKIISRYLRLSGENFNFKLKPKKSTKESEDDSVPKVDDSVTKKTDDSVIKKVKKDVIKKVKKDTPVLDNSETGSTTEEEKTPKESPNKWDKLLEDCGLTEEKIKKISSIFTENELQIEDVKDFDHDLLKSMGMKTAKDRIAILKWAKDK
jgi:hypothetical protein